MHEHIDCGGRLNVAIGGTGALEIVCQKCHEAWSGSLSAIRPYEPPVPGVARSVRAVTSAETMHALLRKAHPDWFV